LEQVFRLTGKNIQRLAADRGYREKKEINGTQILIPDRPKARDTYYQRKKKHQLFCKRAGIEPTIGHLKTDYRLGRNFYKGLFGDAINVMLAAAAYNFKRAMKVLWLLLKKIIQTLLAIHLLHKYAF
jgi:IS5 family transposase